jgi:lactoylglutathione lyase
MDVIHTAVAVSDIEETLAFYTEALDLAYAHEFELNGVRNVYVAGEDGAEIQFKHDPDRTDPIEPSGIDHLAVEVERVRETFEDLVATTDCPVVTEPTVVEPAGARAAFVEDPDGYVVELVEYLD